MTLRLARLAQGPEQRRRTLAAGLGGRIKQGIRRAAAEAVLKELYRPIRDGLVRTERVLARAAAESGHVIQPMAQHLLRRPGKRIRAALVLFSSRSGRADLDHAAELAAAVEMLHMASLVHDDILDGATMRRNQRSLHAVWGTHQAVLMGDFLFARNFCVLADRFPLPVTQSLLHAAQLLCDGEIEETAVAFQPDISEKRYLAIIGKKTAALMAGACESGAILAGVSQPVQMALRRYGYAFGMAFQLIDDALDFSGDQREVGKPVGADLVEGKFTMPVLYLRHTLKGRENKRFMKLLAPLALSNGGISEVIGLVKEQGGLTHTLNRAEAYLKRALVAIEDIPAAAREPLKTLAGYALERRK